MSNIKICFILSILLCLTACKLEKTEEGYLIKTKEPEKKANIEDYPIVVIGNQIWMAKNINVKRPGSRCYDNKPENCLKYGRLYAGDVANEVCPVGWKLPSVKDFLQLLETVNPIESRKDLNDSALKDYKAKLSQSLRSSSWDGLDEFGFAVLPAGQYSWYSKYFLHLDSNAFFWTSTANDTLNAFRLEISYNDVNIKEDALGLFSSVRCILKK